MSVLHGEQRNTKEITLLGLIEQRALIVPDKVALKFRNEMLTYAEVCHAVNRLAGKLQQSGVGKESLVGIYMDRSEKMIVSILAVMKAGGAYVPLDPAHPIERNKYIIEKSHIAILLSESKYEHIFDVSAKNICVDQIWNEITSAGEENCENRLQGGDQLAYVIFTSGSTGNPKGVEVEHEGMVNYLLSVSEHLDLNGSEHGLSVVTITFDISISEMFLPLISGGTLIVADNETAKDGSLLAKLIEEEQIDLCGFTPSTAYMLLDAGLRNLQGMKMLIGGEPWSIQLAQDILDCGCSQLWNVYGPTETTIYSTMYQITKADTYIPIGAPICQTDIYVLDHELKPVETGVEGELYIGGIGVARGYFENPELTEERFIPNPLDANGGRIYKTGDVVKFVNEKDIVYIGRSDFQVKVHGYRIELGEIETAIMKHAAVAQAVVVVSGENAEAKIKAYIKMKTEERPAVSDMKSFVEGVLPYYMVPNVFRYVDEYPMTANLKVDRKALMLMTDDVEDQNGEFVAPRNEIEEMVADIWKQLLNIDKVSVHDDFLALGGHSLLANRMVKQLNNTFGTTIKLVEIFSRVMTIEEIASLVEDNLFANLSEEEIQALVDGE